MVDYQTVALILQEYQLSDGGGNQQAARYQVLLHLIQDLLGCQVIRIWTA
jgi:hypothetical protein